VNVLQVTVLASNPITLAQCAANLRSAVHVALYRLPRDFSREDLYMAIASISYLGKQVGFGFGVMFFFLGWLHSYGHFALFLLL
jgi:hypothetical protein